VQFDPDHTSFIARGRISIRCPTKLILGVKFADGIEVVARKAAPQPETAAV
jgi:hypothetical protein